MAKKNNNNVDVEDLKKKILPIIRIAILGPKGVGKTSIVN
jgi:GTPase SAR1 family protein